MINSLTSLRFVFAFMVFLSHNMILSGPIFLNHIFSEGYSGVSFFFILSGFILTYSYQERLLSGKISTFEFYKARFARVYPLHLMTLVIALVLLQRPSFTLDYCGLFLSNITLLQSFVPAQHFYFSFNSPSWSISDEMFFYVMFPLLVYLLNKKRNYFFSFICMAIAILFILSIEITNERIQHFLFYINPLFRIIDFCLGIALYHLCIWIKRKNIEKSMLKWGQPLEIFAVICFIFFYLYAYYLPQVYRYSFWYWIPMSLVISVFYLSRHGFLSKILSNKSFIYLGEISFGFYLFHQLIGRVFNVFLSKVDITLPWIIHFIIVLASTLIVSHISYKYFEIPCNKWIKSLKLSTNKVVIEKVKEQ